jgi:maleate cis-trans isomerase
MAGVKADAVFLSCTKCQAVDTIGALEQRLGLPITSNHAAIE